MGSGGPCQTWEEARSTKELQAERNAGRKKQSQADGCGDMWTLSIICNSRIFPCLHLSLSTSSRKVAGGQISQLYRHNQLRNPGPCGRQRDTRCVLKHGDATGQLRFHPRAGRWAPKTEKNRDNVFSRFQRASYTFSTLVPRSNAPSAAINHANWLFNAMHIPNVHKRKVAAYGRYTNESVQGNILYVKCFLLISLNYKWKCFRRRQSTTSFYRALLKNPNLCNTP